VRILEESIEALKRRAEELCGGQMTVGTLDDYPSEVPEEVEERLWKHVVDYEEAPWTTHFQQLESAGVSLPAPDSLHDEELTAKRWEIIQKPALLHVFISQTDHLSDRESIPKGLAQGSHAARRPALRPRPSAAQDGLRPSD
jgi:hypothetical protein